MIETLTHNRVGAPASHVPLVGRQRLRQQLRDVLLGDTCRLLALTGAPGIGKTRLALALAAELTGAFPDGVHVVSLEAIDDPTLVAPAIARALGVEEYRNQS